jgi:hypothetical protein
MKSGEGFRRWTPAQADELRSRLSAELRRARRPRIEEDAG